MTPPRKPVPPPPLVAQAKRASPVPPAVHYPHQHPHQPVVAQAKTAGIAPPPVRYPGPGVLQAQLDYVRGVGRESWQGWLTPWRDRQAQRTWWALESMYDRAFTILHFFRPASDDERRAKLALEVELDAIDASPVQYSQRAEVHRQLTSLRDRAQALVQAQADRAAAALQLENDRRRRAAEAQEANRQRMLREGQERKGEVRERKTAREVKEREVKVKRGTLHEERRLANLERAARRAQEEEAARALAPPPPAAAAAATVAVVAPPRAWRDIFRDDNPALASHAAEGDWGYGASDLGVFNFPDGLCVHIHFRGGSRRIRRAHTRGIFGDNIIYNSGDAAGARARDIGGWQGAGLLKCTALLPE